MSPLFPLKSSSFDEETPVDSFLLLFKLQKKTHVNAPSHQEKEVLHY